MAIESPVTHTESGLVWRIRGVVYTRRTRIELLLRGRYATCLRENPDLRSGAISTLAGALRINAPVDTGMLRRSIRVEAGGGNPAVTLGPDPYDRTLLKARLAGRATVRRRRRGRPRLSRFYALPANARSGRQEYIEKSIRDASGPIITACKNYTSVRESERDLELAMMGPLSPARVAARRAR